MRLFLFILSIFSLSCTTLRPTKLELTPVSNSIESTKKEHNEVNSVPDTVSKIVDFNVQVSIQRNVPYCGGAAPTQDMLHRTAPVNGSFIIKDSKNNNIQQVNSTNGLLLLKLPEGNYTIKESFKDVTFQDFQSSQQHNKGGYIISGTEDCYKKWWESNLLEFKVTQTDSVLRLNAYARYSCYTGNNPCDYYNGPVPP